MVASKLVLILDDLLWVLTDSQLKAMVQYAKSLSEAMERSAQQRKSMATEEQVATHVHAHSHAHTRTHLCVCVCVCVYIYIYLCIYTNTHALSLLCSLSFIHSYVCSADMRCERRRPPQACQSEPTWLLD